MKKKDHQGESLKRQMDLSPMTGEEISQKSGISRSHLYNLTKLEVIDDYHRECLKKAGIFIEDVDQNVHPVDKSADAANMIIVPIKAIGGFLTGYGNRVYLNTLERVSFPFVRGECFAFEVEGYSMVKDDGDKEKGFPPGSYVVCTVLESISWLRRETPYVFQTTDGIILKEFVKIEGENCHLRSYNKDYNPVKPIHLKSIKVYYHIELKISKP